MTYSIKNIVKESSPALTLATAIALAAGLILNFNSNLLSILPGILIIIPSFNLMNGAITSVLSSRLSSALHLGLVHPKLHMTKTLNRNIVATLVISVVSFFVFGMVAWAFNTALGVGTSGFWAFSIAVLVAGFTTSVILSFLSIFFSYVSYSKNIDPDNWVIPILTTVGDFMGILLLFLIAGIAL